MGNLYKLTASLPRQIVDRRVPPPVPAWSAEILADPAGAFPVQARLQRRPGALGAVEEYEVEGRAIGEDLASHVWWPFEEVKPAFEETTHELTVASEEIDEANRKVVVTYEPVALAPEITADKLDALKTEYIAKVKKDAHTRILALVPGWTEANHAEKQRNAISRGVQLLRKIATNTASPAEIAEADAIEAVFDGVQAIREASNTAEGAIAAAGDRAAILAAYAAWQAQG